MPRISKRVLTFRERQRRGAVMRPSTFAEIEREAAAGGARDPRAVAGAAYWKTLAARYRGNPISEEPDPRYPGELRFVEWRRAMLTFINSHWYGGTLTDGEFRHIAHIVHMPPEAGADWSFIRDADDQDVIAVFLYVQGRHPELGPHRGFNPRELDVPTKHQIAIAKKTLKMSDAMVGVMGGMTKAQAREILRKHGKGNPYFQETLARGSRQVVIWANEEGGPFHVDKYLNHGETPAGKLTARPLKSLKKARERGEKWLEAMSRSNPDELPEAERLYETFHGREPREILELTESAVSRGDYVALGDLVELTIVTPEGQHVKVAFKNDGVRLASTAEGTQLVLLGGNQDISGTLAMFGSADASKDLLDLGEAKQIVYDAAKWQTDFTPQEWKHDFGEESGIRPRVFFDQLNKRLMFAGGTYRVERPGIVD